MDTRTILQIIPQDVLIYMATYLTLADLAHLASTNKFSEKISQAAITKKTLPTKDLLQYLQKTEKEDEEAYVSKKFDEVAKYLHSTYYKTIKDKIEKKETVTAEEMLVYALTTDDISTVNYNDLNTAYEATKDKLTLHMQENIECMLATLKAFYSKEKVTGLDVLFIQSLAKREINKNKNTGYFNLSKLDFQAAVFTNMYLVGANLKQANLQKVVASGSNFENANLFKSNLSLARFENANFTDANLYRAILKGANFEKAIFTGAHMIRRNFTRGKEIKELKEDLNFLHAQIKDHKQFDRFEKVIAQDIIPVAKNIDPNKKKAFLETALGHDIFKKTSLQKVATLFGGKQAIGGRWLIERELENLNKPTYKPT